MREALIATYHQSLAGDRSLTPEFLRHLKSMMRGRLLVYGDRAIGVSLRPHLLSRQQYATLVHSAEVVAAGIEKVVATMLDDPSSMENIGMTEREIKLALVDPKQRFATVTSRLDAFVHGNEVKFVEYNAENPSSITDQQGLNEVLREVSAMQDLEACCDLRQFSPPDHLLNTLLHTYREWGGTGLPRIAILDWSDLPTASEFAVLQEFFARNNVNAIICSPEQLTYEKGRLRWDDFEIDLVYKRVIINELLDAFDDSHPLISAYVAGDVCVVNPFRCKLAHKKAAFELLTDESNARLFSATDWEIIQRTVPWTRLVTERKTRHKDRDVDLIEYIRKNQTEFILKPNDDYGGRGVVFGDRVSTSEWEEALKEALTSDYVVQEKLELWMEDFPIFDEDRWSLQPMYVDTNPFLFHGRVEGAMVRLSDSPVVNVTSGGGETGFFVIDD